MILSGLPLHRPSLPIGPVPAIPFRPVSAIPFRPVLAISFRPVSAIPVGSVPTIPRLLVFWRSLLAVLTVLMFAVLEVSAEPSLPLSFDLGVYPEAKGTVTDTRIDWRWSDSLSSTAGLSFTSSSDSGDLPEFGTGALYTISSDDGSFVVSPVVWSDRLGSFRYTLAAGLGLKTESFRERGTYQSVGTQVFDNKVSSWRIGLPLGSGLATRLGPVELDWDLVVWPLSLYSLEIGRAHV